MEIIRDEDFLKFIGRQQSQFVAPASEYKSQVRSRLAGETRTSGDLLPWSKSHNNVSLRPGEVSVWAGYNGHGKSQLLGQVCAWALRKSSWLIASMEMPIDATLTRMVRQISATNDPDPAYSDKFLDWTDGRLWLYDQTDTVEPKIILGLVHYAASIGVKHIIIDSLMKCGIRSDDLPGQAAFVDRLCWAAKSTGIHVHLVHHMRKGESEFKRPDKHDLRGAGEITDLVDNVFIVHRNKEKEEKLRKNPHGENSEPDATLGIVKQRHGEWEGIIALWFNAPSMQFTPDASNRANWLAFE